MFSFYRPTNVQTFIIESRITDYFCMNREYNITLQQKLGAGSYGIVYDIGDGLVIKIFFNSILGRTVFEEKTCMIPYKNENRELTLYFRLIKEDYQRHLENNIIPPLSIGYIKNDVRVGKDDFKRNSYFVILPLCIPFHKYYKIKNNPLIDYRDCKKFIFEFLYKTLRGCQYLENEYQVIHLDIKLNNIMYLFNRNLFRIEKDAVITTISEETKITTTTTTTSNSIEQRIPFEFHENMIVLDFSLIKKRNEEQMFEIDELDKTSGQFNYYIWPQDNLNFKVIHIPSYSIGINVIELLLGKDKVMRLNSQETLTEYLMEIYEKQNEIGYLLRKCLIDKITTNEFMEFVENIRI